MRFDYWNFLRTLRLMISRETIYITQPLRNDGTRIDYVAAWEQDLNPPEMKTHDNGYRLIVCALGDAPDSGQDLDLPLLSRQRVSTPPTCQQ